MNLDQIFSFIVFYYFIGFFWAWFANCMYNVRYINEDFKLVSTLSTLLNATLFWVGLIFNIFFYVVKKEEIFRIDFETSRQIIRISFVIDPLYRGKIVKDKE